MSRSEKTNKIAAQKRSDKHKQKNRASAAARQNRQATMSDLEAVRKELHETNTRLAEQGNALALVRYALRLKLGVTDEDLASYMNAMRRGDALDKLTRLKAMGLAPEVLKRQCQGLGFNTGDFPQLFGSEEEKDAK